VGQLPIDAVHERLVGTRRPLSQPHASLDRNTSGSSSGTGAAIAANLAAAGIGSETDGSIVSLESCARSLA
jgi:Asp-tRNA(Asn)/Glu-tRNA(Gln) amidotransferase A subunit family amidase